jgi:peptidoglycan/xylan/chitin deacetylase (PgdA/CDA1 family)
MTAFALASHRIPVLRYRRIGGAADDPRSVSPASFREHVRIITSSGRTALRITQVSELLHRRRAPPAPVVAITFDDGYAETLPAVEQLAAQNVPSTAYLTAPVLDTPEHLSGAQLRTLTALDEMLELGAQVSTAPHLDAIPLDEARDEISASKRALELAAERPVSTFAYPNGTYDDHVQAVVRATGFQSAATVKEAMSHPEDDPWAIARYTVDAQTELADIEALLHGRGAPLAWEKQRLSTRLARSSRRIRNRLGHRRV